MSGKFKANNELILSFSSIGILTCFMYFLGIFKGMSILVMHFSRYKVEIQNTPEEWPRKRIITGRRETCRCNVENNHMVRENVETHLPRGTLVVSSKKRHAPGNKPVILNVLTM